MLDVPKDMSIKHTIDAKDLNVNFRVYNAEKRTLLGAPIDSVITAAITAGAVYGVYKIIQMRRKKKP